MTTNDPIPAEKLTAAEAESARWREAISKIETSISTVTAEIAAHEGTRSEHALAAAMGEDKASTSLEAAHEAQRRAEMRLADLLAGLEQAKPRLALAQAEEAAARHAVRLIEARKIADRRIEAAKAVDDAGAALESALKVYYDLWDELSTINEIAPVGSGMSVLELRRGDGRVKVAMPASLRRIFDVHGEGGSLAKSEELVWKGTLACCRFPAKSAANSGYRPMNFMSGASMIRTSPFGP